MNKRKNEIYDNISYVLSILIVVLTLLLLYSEYKSEKYNKDSINVNRIHIKDITDE